MSSELFIGLISGTSRDGVDAALVDFRSNRPVALEILCTPYPARLRHELDELLIRGERPPAAAVSELDTRLGEFFGAQALALLEKAGRHSADIQGIGSHGQTIWHEPGGPTPISWQLGSGAVIARATGITTVSDFRTADVLAGGQGAPLAPLLHHHLFRPDQGRVTVLNLGGIANLTLLDSHGGVAGFDSGPANCLMDIWIQQQQGQGFDDRGAWAASGEVLPGLLERCLSDPYFETSPPKSTGLERFNRAWLASQLGQQDHEPRDVQRTLAELTVRTITDSLGRWPAINRLLVCGGGVHNEFLMSLLSDRLNPIPVESTAATGIGPDWVEAILFAWLARERLLEHRQDTRRITGASGPVLLGNIHTT